MSHTFYGAGWGSRRAEPGENGWELTTWLRSNHIAINSRLPAEQWQWTQQSPTGNFRVEVFQKLWAVMEMGNDLAIQGTGWVVGRRASTTADYLQSPDIDYFWTCVRTLPEDRTKAEAWGWHNLEDPVTCAQVLGYNRQYNLTLSEVIRGHTAEGHGREANEAHNESLQRINHLAIQLIRQACYEIAVSAAGMQAPYNRFAAPTSIASGVSGLAQSAQSAWDL